MRPINEFNPAVKAQQEQATKATRFSTLSLSPDASVKTASRRTGKSVFFATIMFAFILGLGIQAKAGDNHTGAYTPPTKEAVAAMTGEQKAARLEEIKARVQEIKEMDKSTLTHEQKKALKAELKSMHKESRAIGGIYISIGALIIIILLLIIIL